MRLIDYDKLAKTVNGCSDNWTPRQREGAELMLDIAEFLAEETVDAVEVVRCKDCIHDGLSTCPLCYIESKTLVFVNHDQDFYCSYGERRAKDDL